MGFSKLIYILFLLRHKGGRKKEKTEEVDKKIGVERCKKAGTICEEKIQDICIFQIVNKIRINKGQMGYEMETSELLSLSLFCITSKNT